MIINYCRNTSCGPPVHLLTYMCACIYIYIYIYVCMYIKLCTIRYHSWGGIVPSWLCAQFARRVIMHDNKTFLWRAEHKINRPGTIFTAVLPLHTQPSVTAPSLYGCECAVLLREILLSNLPARHRLNRKSQWLSWRLRQQYTVVSSGCKNYSLKSPLIIRHFLCLFFHSLCHCLKSCVITLGS